MRQTTKYLWMVDVIEDMQRFMEANGFQSSLNHLTKVKNALVTEIAQKPANLQAVPFLERDGRNGQQGINE